MSEAARWQFELEEYIKQGEPGKIEKSEAWQTAIGKSLSTIKRLMKSLQDKNYIRRESGKRYGKWVLLI